MCMWVEGACVCLCAHPLFEKSTLFENLSGKGGSLFSHDRGPIFYLFQLWSGNLRVLFFFLRFYLFIFRGGEGEKEGEKHHCVVAPLAPPTGDPACNPGWE